jgi:hypothetical protein
MRERRAAEASERLSTGADLETLSDGKSIPNPTPGWRSPYAPRPADPLPEPADPRVESPATRGRVQHDLSGIPASVRQDPVRLQQVLAAQQVAGDSRSPDGRTTWSEIAGGTTDLAEMRAAYGMHDQPPFVHDAYFERPTGRRHALPDSEMIPDVFYRRGR